MQRIVSFQQLEAWQRAHELVLSVYKATRVFPQDERYGLRAQMRRAAVSVPANVAEGFKRRGLRDKVHFYNVSEGSLEELKYYLILSQDLGYLTAYADLMPLAEQVGRLIHGLIASTERRR